KTFQTRNADVATGLGLEKFPLVVGYKGKDFSGRKLIPFISAGFSGQIGVFTGMNSYGVCIGQIWAFSHSKAIGTPWSLAMREVLSQAKTATDAAIIFTSFDSRTYGNNFLFADATGDA